MDIFSKFKKAPTTHFERVRRKAFERTVEEVGLSPKHGLAHVWGAILDQGVPNATFTFASFVDGKSEMYWGYNGEILGADERQIVRTLSEDWLRSCESALKFVPVGEETSVPPEGEIRLTLLTHEGNRTLVVPVSEVTASGHPLRSSFLSAHKAIAELLKFDDERRQ